MTSSTEKLLLIGVGGAGAALAARIAAAYGREMRVLVVDTDRDAAIEGREFLLCVATRFSGRGTGGDTASARAAFQDNPAVIDPFLDGVRTAVVVTCLGGGAGWGLAAEILVRLRGHGITSLAIATTPFAFEGQQRIQRARTDSGTIAQLADTSAILPLDQLAASQESTLKDAIFRDAMESVAAGATLLWRMAATPGYIALDPERLRKILSGGARAQFAYAAAEGADRIRAVADALAGAPGVKNASRAREYFIGVLAGDDLRLAEIASLTGALAMTLGQDVPYSLATVNDEEEFSGKVAAVLLVFEELSRGHARKPGRQDAAFAGSDRFAATGATIVDGENLDIPTFMRRNLTLEI